MLFSKTYQKRSHSFGNAILLLYLFRFEKRVQVPAEAVHIFVSGCPAGADAHGAVRIVHPALLGEYIGLLQLRENRIRQDGKNLVCFVFYVHRNVISLQAQADFVCLAVCLAGDLEIKVIGK